MSNPASRSTRALRSSTALHHTKSRTSGWSTLRTTIFAARRVFPPDLMVPAEASAPRMNDTGPLAVPPPASFSFDERIDERFRPDPDPPLKIVPSSTYQLRMDDMVSSTERMKQAEHCGFSSAPTLNHTGELNAAFWLARRWVSSSENTRASASESKYPSFAPQAVMVSTTRPIMCLTEDSRSGVPSVPRKYFWATMFVAFWDQPFGNSTSRCSKAFPPSLKLGITASRISQSISSYGWTPSWVNC